MYICVRFRVCSERLNVCAISTKTLSSHDKDTPISPPLQSSRRHQTRPCLRVYMSFTRIEDRKRAVTKETSMCLTAIRRQTMSTPPIFPCLCSNIPSPFCRNEFPLVSKLYHAPHFKQDGVRQPPSLSPPGSGGALPGRHAGSECPSRKGEVVLPRAITSDGWQSDMQLTTVRRSVAAGDPGSCERNVVVMGCDGSR